MNIDLLINHKWNNYTAYPPLDSRYSKSIEELQKYFSYESWIKYRVRFELLYFKFLYTTLSDDKEVGNTTKWNISSNNLERFVNQEINVTEILDIEKHIYHDIKSIELYLKRKYSEWILVTHFIVN